jgi:hypothetical protein
MPDLTVDVAREVVKIAIARNAYSWDGGIDRSGDEVEVVQIATDLIERATTALNKGIKNPNIDAILEAAGSAPTNGHVEQTSPAPAPSEAQETRSKEQASSSPVGSAEPVKEAAPAAGEAVDIESIYPGYDSQTVDGIIKAITHFASTGDLLEEEWLQILAYEASHEAREEILKLVPTFKSDEPEPAPEAPEPVIVPESTIGPVAEPVGDNDLEASYHGANPSRAAQERLPIPPMPQTDAALVMPVDITAVGDAELSQLATSYHSHFARAQWLQSQEEGRERYAEHLEGEAHRDAFAQSVARHESAIPDDKRTASAVENARRQAGHDADSAQPVRVWRSRKIDHGIQARELKALAAIYDKAVWRINEELQRRSRLATTRPIS